MQARLQTTLDILFPPRCVGCGALVAEDFALCGRCWGATPFITGLTCDGCGAPLPGPSDAAAVHCDDCLTLRRPWRAGRSALIYRDLGRRLVLALKHGGRLEVARPAAQWMQRAARDLPLEGVLVAPVPLHWTRLFRRTFNQAAVLAQAFAARGGHACCPDLLRRDTRTASLDHKSPSARFAALEGAVSLNPRHGHRIDGQPVLLIDYVMTSGATLTAASRACLAAGSGPVFVLTLARAVKDA